MEKINVQVALDRSFLMADKEQTAFVMLKLNAPELPMEKRPQQNLSFVIDRSGSMAGDKLGYTKKAVAFALGHLSEEDYGSVVTFDDSVDLLRPSANILNKDLIRKEVKSIYPGGSTNLSGGMLAGISEVRKNFGRERINRVLLLTDGMANVGVTDPESLTNMAREVASSGVTLSTFGLGEDFQENLLKSMAEAGSGNFYYIESPDQIPGIFEQELSGLLSIVAQNIRVKITPGPVVDECGVLGYVPEVGEKGLIVTLPDIYSGETKTIVMALNVVPNPQGVNQLLEMEIEYADVRRNLALVNLKANLKVDFNADGSEPSENLEVVKYVEILQAAKAKEEAIKLADDGDFEGSRRVLQKHLHSMMELSESMDEDAELMNEINDLEMNLNCISEGTSKYKTTRKQVLNSAYTTMTGRGRKRR
ncbi:MAG: VWA domain-containing protein [Firmicutes bacterium]|nr:VWA domain-containing protein [Bacillota bacterium]